MFEPFHKPVLLAIATCSLALGAMLILSACSKDDAPPPTVAPVKTQQSVAKATAQQQAALVALSLEDLKKNGSQAMREQRLYAPAGDNAMEYYLTLRRKSAKPDASVESALSELMPYVVIAAEQAIGRADFVEAERLRTLMERADPQAPALSRITGLIAKGKSDAEQNAASEAARAEQLAKAAEVAKLKAAQQEEAARLATATISAPVAPVVPPPAIPESSIPTPTSTPVVTAPITIPTSTPTSAPAVPAKTSPPAPSPATTQNILTPISTPQPSYPPEAQRAGKVGAVVASFTVNTDGSVSNITIVSSKPRGVFDRSVQAAVRRWKFQPIDKAQTVTRTFNFTL